jgi:hypothetical protein
VRLFHISLGTCLMQLTTDFDQGFEPTKYSVWSTAEYGGFTEGTRNIDRMPTQMDQPYQIRSFHILKRKYLTRVYFNPFAVFGEDYCLK